MRRQNNAHKSAVLLRDGFQVIPFQSMKLAIRRWVSVRRLILSLRRGFPADGQRTRPWASLSLEGMGTYGIDYPREVGNQDGKGLASAVLT